MEMKRNSVYVWCFALARVFIFAFERGFFTSFNSNDAFFASVSQLKGKKSDQGKNTIHFTQVRLWLSHRVIFMKDHLLGWQSISPLFELQCRSMNTCAVYIPIAKKMINRNERKSDSILQEVLSFQEKKSFLSYISINLHKRQNMSQWNIASFAHHLWPLCQTLYKIYQKKSFAKIRAKMQKNDYEFLFA